jgi:hypothetical protein
MQVGDQILEYTSLSTTNVVFSQHPKIRYTTNATHGSGAKSVSLSKLDVMISGLSGYFVHSLFSEKLDTGVESLHTYRQIQLRGSDAI